jgi:preprotein translocase subunit SecA
VPAGLFHDFERSVLLQHLDSAWREHLAALDHLRQGIHLRGYAQKDPKQEYKREAFHLFESLLERVRDEVIALLMSVEVASEQEIAQAAEQAQAKAAATPKDLSFNHPDFNGPDDQEGQEEQPLAEVSQTIRREFPKVGRNDPCPCGSGQKFKNCHGALK